MSRWTEVQLFIVPEQKPVVPKRRFSVLMCMVVEEWKDKVTLNKSLKDDRGSEESLVSFRHQGSCFQ